MYTILESEKWPFGIDILNDADEVIVSVARKWWSTSADILDIRSNGANIQQMKQIRELVSSAHEII